MLLDPDRQLNIMSRQRAAQFFASGRGRLVPRFLYKFNPGSSLEVLQAYLLNSTLFLASPESFNDPFDVRAVVEFTGSLLARRKYLLDKMREMGIDKAQREGRASAILVSRHLTDEIQKSFDTN